MNATVLWVIAAILVVVGIVQLLQGQILLGIASDRRRLPRRPRRLQHLQGPAGVARSDAARTWGGFPTSLC